MMRKCICFFVLACVMAACETNEEVVDAVKESAISIGTGIEALSRSPQLDEAGAGNFSKGDVFLLTMSGEGMESITTNYEVGCTELSWNEFIFPPSLSKIHFAGCYPALPEISGGEAVFDSFSASEPDLLLAAAVEADKGSSETIRLQFRHALHRLKLVYDSSAGYSKEELGELVTTCTAQSACRVNVEKGTIEEVLSQVSATKRNGRESVFILPSQSTSAISLKIEFRGMTVERTLSEWLGGQNDWTSLDRGKEFTLRFNVGKEGIEVVSSGIEGWENQGTADSEIIM